MAKECNACQSCLMPFAKDPGVRESPLYCSYCFKDGALCYQGNDVREFKKRAFDSMIRRGTPKLLAHVYTFMIGFAPRWKK